MPVRKRQPFKRYELYKGQVVNIQHDANTYTDAHSTSVSSFATQDVDTGIAVGSESTTGNQWTAQVTANNVGQWLFELVITYADSSKQILPFQIDVYELS